MPRIRTKIERKVNKRSRDVVISDSDSDSHSESDVESEHDSVKKIHLKKTIKLDKPIPPPRQLSKIKATSKKCILYRQAISLGWEYLFKESYVKDIIGFIKSKGAELDKWTISEKIKNHRLCAGKRLGGINKARALKKIKERLKNAKEAGKKPRRRTPKERNKYRRTLLKTAQYMSKLAEEAPGSESDSDDDLVFPNRYKSKSHRVIMKKIETDDEIDNKPETFESESSDDYAEEPSCAPSETSFALSDFNPSKFR